MAPRSDTKVEINLSRNSTSSSQREKETSPQAPPSNEYADAEENFDVKSLKFWLIIISVYLCFFLIALDRMIIATAIPAITNTFGSIKDIGWYGSGYMLTCAIFNLLFGKIYQLYDIKWTFLIAILIFEIGSAICGCAPTSTVLIVGRAIAGIGAAGISCGAIMIIIPLVPLRKRPVFTSFFGLAFGVSSVLGPFLGGTFTDNTALGWRWCFLINLPIGACTFAAVFFFLHLPSSPKAKLPIVDQIKRLDPLGLLFFIPSMVCLILALEWGGTTDPWSAPKIIGLLVTFAVTLVAFLIVEFKMPETAMAPPRVVLNRSVSGAMLFTFVMAGGMMNALYYISIWFQAAQGQSAMQAGVRTIPLVLSLVLFGIVNAIFTQKIGYYVTSMYFAPVLASIASGLLSTLTPHSSASKWIGYQVFYGVGLGCGMQTSNLVAQTVLPRADVSLGLAMMFFVQQQGGAIFLAVGQNLFSQQLVKELSGIAGLDTQAVINSGATELRKTVPVDEIDTVISAYSYSLTRVFILAAALSACMIFGALMVEWRSIKGNGQPGREPKDAEADVAAEK
ncbi:aflatoxin efflux pump aflt [Stemphylium lycopersici]|uniref:Azole resistance protein n=1 Tax=Stemphylium lycopersici TaxID=183478 RepID=A0A364NFX1_STELY|nr:aflatoxin efflux pump aflt [Stemphylium lycopersici]RAR16162.1 azole resistance protein [Stemphylium lycopersici]